MRSTCSAHLILHDFVTQITLGSHIAQFTSVQLSPYSLSLLMVQIFSSEPVLREYQSKLFIFNVKYRYTINVL